MPHCSRRLPLRRPAAITLAALFPAAGLAACLAACSSSTPVLTRETGPGVEARASAFPIEHDGWSRLGYRYDWTAYPYVSGQGRIRFADAYQDVLIVQETGGILSVVETTNGGVRWSTELANPLTKFVGNARDGDRIICSSESEAFILTAATGNLMARQRIEKVVNTRPLLVERPGGALAIYGTPTGEVLAHYLGQSIKVWGFDTPGAIEGRPVMMGSVVGAVSQTGDVFFLDSTSGSLQGRARIFDGVSNDPVTNGQLMFIASLDQSLYAFAPSGTQVWRYRGTQPLRAQPTADGGTVYCTIPELGLTSFDALSGKINWSAKQVAGTVVARNKNRLITWDGATACLIDPELGDVIERIPLKGVDFLTTDKYEDGTMYAVAKSGVIARFLPR